MSIAIPNTPGTLCRQDPPEILNVVVLSDPATMTWHNAPSYWIFEMHILPDAIRQRHPLADRALRYLEPDETPPSVSAGDVCRLTGAWLSDKAFRIDRLELLPGSYA